MSAVTRGEFLRALLAAVADRPQSSFGGPRSRGCSEAVWSPGFKIPYSTSIIVYACPTEVRTSASS
jgi:hypothetical protein